MTGRTVFGEESRLVLACVLAKAGYEINADYNAAKNIGLRYVRKQTHRLLLRPRRGAETHQ